MKKIYLSSIFITLSFICYSQMNFQLSAGISNNGYLIINPGINYEFRNKSIFTPCISADIIAVSLQSDAVYFGVKAGTLINIDKNIQIKLAYGACLRSYGESGISKLQPNKIVFNYETSLYYKSMFIAIGVLPNVEYAKVGVRLNF